MTALLLAAALLAPGSATPGAAELEQVRQQVAELEARLRRLESRQADLTRERERLESELRLAELKVDESEAEGRALEAEVAEASRAVNRTQAAMTEAAERLRGQLSLLAVLGRAGLSPLVLHGPTGGRDVTERITVVLALVRDQRRRRDELARLVEHRAAALAALSSRLASLDVVRAELVSRRGDLAQTRERVRGELARLERQRRAGAAELAQAHEAQVRLERLWGVVTREDAVQVAEVRLLRGGLPWPVDGARVIRRFGSHRDPQYGTTTVSHGLTFDAPAGARVSAVAAGKVAYAQFFKGYGNLVILQHPGQIYSLYAQLASMLVRAGQRVAIGDPVGLTGTSENGEGNFYLEVRVGQQAQDPALWLKPAGR